MFEANRWWDSLFFEKKLRNIFFKVDLYKNLPRIVLCLCDVYISLYENRKYPVTFNVFPSSKNSHSVFSLCIDCVISLKLKNMEKHYGEIIERTIRRNGYSISELSRVMKVNRRSIYNWFNQPKFKPEIIFKIGCALKHDFSSEFPELFSSEDFQRVFGSNRLSTMGLFTDESEKINYWKDKYINLLEEYNQILTFSGNQQSRTMSYSAL